MSSMRCIFFLIFLVNFVLCVDNFVDNIDGDNNNDNSSNSKILFPHENGIENQEIPLELIRRLNMLSSVEEFFRSMVEGKEIEISDRMGVGSYERGFLKGERAGKCMPELKTISLQPNQTTTTFYYPRCARVKRCGGCCLHDLFTCRPVEKEVIPITVAIAEYRTGHQFRLKEKKIIEIEQHTKCECNCKVQPQDCTKYQMYSPENCRCECPNERERNCYKKIWNPDICSCICRNELTCGTGFEFDFFTCSCVSSRGRKKSSFLYRIYV